MPMTPKGSRLALLTAVCVVVTLSLAVWLGWGHMKFWWRFEALGQNAQGLPEFRHRQTGLIFIQIPGDLVPAHQTKDDASIEYPPATVTVAPFLISKDVVRELDFIQHVSNRSWTVTSMFHPRFPEDCCREFCNRTNLVIPTKRQWDILKLMGDPCPPIWLQYPDGIKVGPFEDKELKIETTQGVKILRLPETNFIEFRPAYYPLP